MHLSFRCKQKQKTVNILLNAYWISNEQYASLTPTGRGAQTSSLPFVSIKRAKQTKQKIYAHFTLSNIPDHVTLMTLIITCVIVVRIKKRQRCRPMLDLSN